MMDVLERDCPGCGSKNLEDRSKMNEVGRFNLKCDYTFCVDCDLEFAFPEQINSNAQRMKDARRLRSGNT